MADRDGGATLLENGSLSCPRMECERFQLHGVEWEVLRGGSGPPVLLLHGPMTYCTETPFLGLLAREAEVVAPSHPGFGGSERPDDVDTLYDLVHCYQDLLDTLPSEKVTLVGCSFGGWLAAEVAVNCAH